MEMVPIPLEVLQMMNAEDLADEAHEDPTAIIEEIEKNKRQPSAIFGGGSTNSNLITDDHALELVAESPHSLEIPDLAAQTGNSVHNDVASHSPLYIFMCIVIIAALGFFFWHSTAKDKFQDMINGGGKRQKQGTKGGEEDGENRDINLSSFNKKQ